MRPQDRNVDQRIARIAAAAHGVVTRVQLLAAGITIGEIKHRLRTGSLLPVFRGVYRVGHRAPSRDAQYMAAVRACGHGSVLVGRAGAHLLGLIKGPAPVPEVIAPKERHIEGIRTRRSRVLRPSDIMRRDRIPVARPASILVDLAAVLDEEALARACHEAGVHYRTTPAQVEAVLKRRPKAQGAGALRRIMRGDVRVTLSRLEARFLKHLREDGLDLPVTNHHAGSKRVDCRWPQHRLTVELDSYRFHNSRYAWEQDRKREREARARGDEFRRYTWGDVFEDPRFMRAELRELLRGAERAAA